jgi:hypothetical protein
MLPQIRRILDALDDRQRFVVSTPIAVAQVAILDTRPKDASPKLWFDSDTQVCEARASTVFHIGEVHEEREQPHPLRRPVRALLIMVLPVELADLILEHLKVLGIFIGQHGDIQHPHCQVVDSLRSHASTALVAPALRRRPHWRELVAGQRCGPALWGARRNHGHRLVLGQQVLKLQDPRGVVRAWAGSRECGRLVLGKRGERPLEHGVHPARYCHWRGRI